MKHEVAGKWLALAVTASLGVMPTMASAQFDEAAPLADTAAVAEPAPAAVADPLAAPVEPAAEAPVEAGVAAEATPAVPTSGLEAKTPLYDGGYTAIMGTWQMTQDDPVLSDSFGGVWLAGYRNGWYALETGFGYTTEKGIDRQSFKLRFLLYPFKAVPTLYAVLGGGATRYVKYPVQDLAMNIAGRDDFITGDLAAGLGYILPLRVGNYEFGLRAEAVYELGDRFLERQNDFVADISAPSTFKDVVVNLGLHLPLAFLPPPPPAPEPVKVVEAPKPVDSDGDGVPDDLDMCPDTPAGTQVDAKGCPLVPPCKQPVPGERISLQGCATGDVVVLRGVNFDFDKSKLTVNAKTILDNVGDELKAYPAIKVEIGGHTDAKGSDEYNQRLSEARANAVLKYLVSAGVAADRLNAVGYGESKPVADNETDEGRELNRRVELKIVDGRAEGVSVAPAAPAEASAAAPAQPAALEAPAAADASPFDPIQ